MSLLIGPRSASRCASRSATLSRTSASRAAAFRNRLRSPLAKWSASSRSRSSSSVTDLLTVGRPVGPGESPAAASRSEIGPRDAAGAAAWPEGVREARRGVRSAWSFWERLTVPGMQQMLSMMLFDVNAARRPRVARCPASVRLRARKGQHNGAPVRRRNSGTEASLGPCCECA